MYNNLTPLKIVQYYLNNNGSLRKTAKEFNVHYQTLYKWVKKYKEIIGLKNNEEWFRKEYFFTGYRSPHNRVKREIEEKVCFLKEKYPTLSVRKAKKILEEMGIKISIKGIYNIWKRYGYIGFKKDSLCNNFLNYIPWSKEALKKYEFSKYLYEQGKIKECADILNSIPVLPYNELIVKIPDEYLNFRRKFEKIFHLIETRPVDVNLREIKKYIEYLKIKKFNYSLLRIKILEIILLEWKGKIGLIFKKIKKIKNCSLPFEIKISLLISEGIAYSCCNINKSKKIASYIYSLLKNKNLPYFMLNLASLYSNILEYKKAERLILDYIHKVDEKTAKIYKRVLSNIFFNRGEYKKAMRLLKESCVYPWTKNLVFMRYILFLSILRGNLTKIISLLQTISRIERPNIYGHAQLLFDVAFIYAALGESKKAKRILRKLMLFFKNNKMIYFQKRCEILIGKENKPYSYCEDPLIKILIFLKKGNYRKAFLLAEKKGVKRYLFEFIVYFPHLLEKLDRVKNISFPKYLLKMPVFNKKMVKYYIRFLTKFRIYKDNRYLNVRLSPKQKAFLIHLALRLGEPNKSINLEEIYKNFWPAAKNPIKNLICLLYNIKNKLGIPKHLIEINKKQNILTNKGITFTTDYLDFILSLSQIHRFLAMNNWKFVKAEFFKLSKMVKKEALERFYDTWSEDIRTEILMQYRDAVEKFKKEAMERRDYEAVDKILLLDQGV
ncbi:MAG: helix-turn-helix domain-containing protein [Candidatus Pacearchaeota archaeon]